MRAVALLPALAACYSPTAASGVPCSSTFECPGDEECNRDVSPPTCGAVTPIDGRLADASSTLGPWGPPVRAMVPVGLEDDPTLTSDALELYFNRDQTEIYYTTRDSTASPWKPPTLVTELGAATTPELTSDGRTMYIGSDRTGGEGLDDIYISTLTMAGTWSMPIQVPELSSNVEENTANPSADHLTIAIARRNGFSATDVFVATRMSTTLPWEPPTELAVLTSSRADGDAMLTSDGLAIYFYSTRSNLGDLFVSTREDLASPFEDPIPIDELNTNFVEQDPWISPDGRRLLFSSDRDGEMAIYESTR